MRVWRAWWLAAAVASAAAAQTPAPIVTPAQWMRSLAEEFFVPGYGALENAARELDASTRALCAAPGAAELASAREGWRSVALAWRRLDALPIGPTLTRRSRRQFDFWPTRPRDIEAAIEKGAAGAAAQPIGASARGLPALEYLLFADARLAQPAEAARCRYAARLAGEFAAEAQALAREWREWGEQWRDAESEYAREHAQAAMTDAVNALIGSLDQLRLRRLKRFEGVRSGATRAHLLATLEGVEQGLAGAGRVLRGLGHLDLTDQLDARIAATQRAFRALPAKVDAKAAAPALGRAIDAVARLQAVVSGDVAEALRVTVGFNESDGD
jgi:uncharacterized protein